jgi:hypothetical protein
MIIQQNSITAKRAVEIAKTYLKKLINPQNILLEEIEMSGDGLYWLITLSYDTKGVIDSLFGSPSKRSYKIFRIGAASGEVESMKIRQFK